MVLLQYEQAPDVSEPNVEQQLRAQMRKNITETLIDHQEMEPEGQVWQGSFPTKLGCN